MLLFFFFFFFNDTATTEIYTLSLHDALPISPGAAGCRSSPARARSRHSPTRARSEEHTSELQSPDHLVCRLLLEKQKRRRNRQHPRIRDFRTGKLRQDSSMHSENGNSSPSVVISAMGLLNLLCYVFFFFNDTATTEIYTLSLHYALPISVGAGCSASRSTPLCARRCKRPSSRPS